MTSNNVFPTKGNLMNIKKSLSLAKMGYDLLDRKRNILIREMMSLIDKAKSLRQQISSTYAKAYFALQKAHITLGICEDIANSVPIENGIQIHYHSVMGVELPTVDFEGEGKDPEICYCFSDTNSQFDNAYLCFHRVKVMTVELAEIENSIYRLANAIKKTQSRANSLKNIIIPNFENNVKFISDALEEKEREEFSRLKVIKANKERKSLEMEELGDSTEQI